MLTTGGSSQVPISHAKSRVSPGKEDWKEPDVDINGIIPGPLLKRLITAIVLSRNKWSEIRGEGFLDDGPRRYRPGEKGAGWMVVARTSRGQAVGVEVETSF